MDTEAVRKIRGSYYLIGALLGKYKKAEVALPGGCNIGLRPIDQHIKGFRALGADVRVASPGMVVAKADELLGSHIYMDVVSGHGRGHGHDDARGHGSCTCQGQYHH